MLGIIGGTGLYRMAELEVHETRALETPFGPPSSPLVLGGLRGRPVAFLARHGLHHQLLPGEINYRANIWALKAVGVRTVLGVSAVGSLREPIRPGDLAVPAQYIDFTRGRVSSFFGGGVVAHVSTAHPVCAWTAGLVGRMAASAGLALHANVTYACVEGPRLGTRAESLFLRTAGADLVGMTNVPEVFLAAEAQLGYCTIAVATDYDCWLDDPAQHATVEQVVSRFQARLADVQRLVAAVAAEHRDDPARPCRRGLAGAVLTAREHLSAPQRALVDFLLQE